ncbi:hypothetical protein ACKVMT_02455 [Halobacteriales archaeon Cl-PHB]
MDPVVSPAVPDEHDSPSDGPGDPPDDVPVVSCTRCGREWDLSYELEDMMVGNQAVEQFALDHHRHTGHYPDDLSTWLASCRHCPESVERLSEDGARRWAETHARHTSHDVDLDHASLNEPERIEA